MTPNRSISPILLLLCGWLAAAAQAYAQKSPVVIDTTLLTCEYKTLYYLDTTQRENGTLMGGRFVLQIGRKASKYYELTTDRYERIRTDAKTSANYMSQMEAEIERGALSGDYSGMPLLSRVDALVIYTGYPANRRTVQDAVFLDYYVYEDDAEPQQWTLLTDSVTQILGYTCRKAVCSYRGRDYEAWYAPEIPVSAGPWKFAGLPGLIMSVRDASGHYTFDLSRLDFVREPIEYLTYAERQYVRTDRITFLRTQAKSAQIGLARYIQANAPGGTTAGVSGETARYDLLERDYKK